MLSILINEIQCECTHKHRGIHTYLSTFGFIYVRDFDYKGETWLLQKREKNVSFTHEISPKILVHWLCAPSIWS